MKLTVCRQVRRCLAAGAAIAWGGCAAPSSRPVPAAAAQAIRDTVLALEEAMNSAVDHLDCDRGLSYLGFEEPLFVSTGRVVRTHAELLEMCRAMVAPRLGAEFVSPTVRAIVLSPDAAYVVREGEYRVRFRDGTTRTGPLVMTTVWSHRGGEWKAVHLHESVPRQP